jgi:type IV secretory pathway VirB6-like protein
VYFINYALLNRTIEALNELFDTAIATVELDDGGNPVDTATADAINMLLKRWPYKPSCTALTFDQYTAYLMVLWDLVKDGNRSGNISSIAVANISLSVNGTVRNNLIDFLLGYLAACHHDLTDLTQNVVMGYAY